jgi:hypothetical protein
LNPENAVGCSFAHFTTPRRKNSKSRFGCAITRGKRDEEMKAHTLSDTEVDANFRAKKARGFLPVGLFGMRIT